MAKVQREFMEEPSSFNHLRLRSRPWCLKTKLQFLTLAPEQKSWMKEEYEKALKDPTGEKRFKQEYEADWGIFDE